MSGIGKNIPAKKEDRHHDGKGVKSSEHLNITNYINTAGLLNGAADLRSISREQNQSLANEFERCSVYPAPIGLTPSDCVCLPPDILVYQTINKDGHTVKTLTCSELNGTGFGGMHTLPEEQLQTIMNTFRLAAHQIAQSSSQPRLIVIANSGREFAERKEGRYSLEENNKLIYEKVIIADAMANELGCEVISLDDLSHNYFREIDSLRRKQDNGKMTNSEREERSKMAYQQACQNMSSYCKQHLVILGYTRDVVDCCQIEHGQPYLFGRKINGFINDRAAYNLSENKNTPLDLTLFNMINVSFKEGANKYAAACAMSLFNESQEAKELPSLASERGFTYNLLGLDKIFHLNNKKHNKSLNDEHQIKYFSGVTELDGISGVMDTLKKFTSNGLIPLFKPSGAGQGQGIIAYQQGEKTEDFKRRFMKNLKHIQKLYLNGAGYPFLVEPLLPLDKDSSGHLYDLRFVIYQKNDEQGNCNFHSIPLIIKKKR
ncbi:TPA: hypothetical protein ACKP12_004980 [Serratia marcescens]|uniref:hypothetical protein n=1 Tax=Serratia ureilytica TaxID=300181 RepID=UPI0018D710EC|nr:hypothetical protein [Serratia ureilytica]MBH2928740.1 hypothetical protein [Serratia ureilytica]